MKNYRELLHLFHEFNEFLLQIHGLYLDSVAGFKLIVKYIEEDHVVYKELFKEDKRLSTPKFLDKLTFSHSHMIGEEYASSTVHLGKKGKVKARNIKDGKNQQFLGAMVIVLLYSYWENYFREKLATALGVKTSVLLFPIWGDLKVLRHCILHKSKIENKDIKKIQYLKWFQHGDEIIIDEGKFREIFLSMLAFRNWIHEQSLHRAGIRIPMKR